MAPEAKEYTFACEYDLAKLAENPPCETDNRAKITAPFDRVAYYLELKPKNGPLQRVFVSMDAFTNDVSKIGIPAFTSKASFQQNVTSMNVCSDVKGVTTGGKLKGNIEFWANNYKPNNGKAVPGASDKAFDFGDEIGDPPNGYGSMQVHNYEAKQTIFAVNSWKSGPQADIGIGNAPGDNPDWTFTKSAVNYETKLLRVFVRLKK